jgi:hypothetical protein
VKVQFGLENLESFDPATQESYRDSPTTIHMQLKQPIHLAPLRAEAKSLQRAAVRQKQDGRIEFIDQDVSFNRGSR